MRNFKLFLFLFLTIGNLSILNAFTPDECLDEEIAVSELIRMCGFSTPFVSPSFICDEDGGITYFGGDECDNQLTMKIYFTHRALLMRIILLFSQCLNDLELRGGGKEVYHSLIITKTTNLWLIVTFSSLFHNSVQQDNPSIYLTQFLNGPLTLSPQFQIHTRG